MGLKSMILKMMNRMSSELKSDQNGIEIPLCMINNPPPYMLKSDQNGIEICYSHWKLGWGFKVKIRPKWD